MFAVDHAATALLVKRRYPSVPLAPSLVSFQAMELAWVGLNYLGIVCWYIYRGGFGLLALIGLGNLANLSFPSPSIPGPEEFLAGHPLLLVTVIFVQIVGTLVLVGVLARRDAGSTAIWRPRGIGLPYGSAARIR
jgi:hypothetical protein